MNEQRTQPGRWVYALAVLISVLGCLLAMALVYQWFPGLPGTLGSRMNLENLTQVTVPGSEEISFPERGAYGIYYEYRSVFDGLTYSGSKAPPALDCTLIAKTTGAEVAVVPDYVETNTYSTKDRERVGVLIRSITIDQPGTYTFSCRYADGRLQPETVLAVGPNFMWEFLSIGAQTVLTVAAGLAVFLGSGAVSAMVVIVAIIKRRRPKTLHL